MDLQDIIDVFDDEPLTTPEVANAAGISQRAAWVYLSDLADEGQVQRTTGTDLQMDTWSLTDAAEPSERD